MPGPATADNGGARLTRRQAITAALTVAAAVPIGFADTAWAARATNTAATSTPPRLTLPVPTGAFPVGTVPLHLVNPARSGERRDLMISVWYPADNVGRYPRAPWMLAAALQTLLAASGFDPAAAAAPVTSGHEGAPVRRGLGRLPVVVFSHGAHGHRAENTVVVQQLASHGYVVVTVDHSGDAFSEFPDGRVIVPDLPLEPADFAGDIRFVLDRVTDLAAGVNPDAEHRPLPVGLCGALDLQRIGMFGWSKGATATALVMNADRRVRAGLGIEGPMQPTITTDLDRPYLMMTAEFTRAAEPSVAEFWSHLHGWRRNIQAAGAVHTSYSDYQALMPQLAPIVGMSDEELAAWIGTLDPARAVRIQQAYPLAFFDLHLRHRGHLLDRPSPAFPEVAFIP